MTTVAAVDADGNPVYGEQSAQTDFSFATGDLDPNQFDYDGNAFVVKGSDLDEVLVSRVSVYGESSNGFDGVFHIEAVSLEGGSDAGGPLDSIRSYNPSRTGTQKTDTNDYGDYAVESADLPVQFLHPRRSRP